MALIPTKPASYKNKSLRLNRFDKILKNIFREKNLPMYGVVHYQEKHDIHTFVSAAQKRVSWIDHCFPSPSAANHTCLSKIFSFICVKMVMLNLNIH